MTLSQKGMCSAQTLISPYHHPHLPILAPAPTNYKSMKQFNEHFPNLTIRVQNTSKLTLDTALQYNIVKLIHYTHHLIPGFLYFCFILKLFSFTTRLDDMGMKQY